MNSFFHISNHRLGIICFHYFILEHFITSLNFKTSHLLITAKLKCWFYLNTISALFELESFVFNFKRTWIDFTFLDRAWVFTWFTEEKNLNVDRTLANSFSFVTLSHLVVFVLIVSDRIPGLFLRTCQRLICDLDFRIGLDGYSLPILLFFFEGWRLFTWKNAEMSMLSVRVCLRSTGEPVNLFCSSIRVTFLFLLFFPWFVPFFCFRTLLFFFCLFGFLLAPMGCMKMAGLQPIPNGLIYQFADVLRPLRDQIEFERKFYPV